MSKTQPKTLDGFKEFNEIQLAWGYDAQANHSKYEEMCVGDLRQFQHITDYIMRFFARGVFDEDIELFSGIDTWTGNFSIPQHVWLQYIQVTAPYYEATRDLRAEAAEYLCECPKDVVQSLLTISLQWMDAVDTVMTTMTVPALVDKLQRITHAQHTGTQLGTQLGTGTGTVKSAIDAIVTTNTHRAHRAHRAHTDIRTDIRTEYVRIVRRHRTLTHRP